MVGFGFGFFVDLRAWWLSSVVLVDNEYCMLADDGTSVGVRNGEVENIEPCGQQSGNVNEREKVGDVGEAGHGDEAGVPGD